MEKTNIVSVTCPSCQKDGEFCRYETINITEHPSLREDIMKRNIFTYICPHCGEKITVAYDCIYMDTENKYAVALITSDEAVIPEKINAQEFTVRIVRTVNSFIEKIALFEDGIDDRVCELCKLFLGESYEEQNNAELLAAYYGGRDTENDVLHFFLIGDEAGNCETTLSMQSYRNIFEYFSNSQFDDKSETEIDENWALLALKNGIFNIEGDI